MAGCRHRRLHCCYRLVPTPSRRCSRPWGGKRPTPRALVAKWKVGVLDPDTELQLLEQLLEQLPTGALLRLDANGGWDRATAGRWAMRLQNESKLQWLEQPLPPSDHAGLLALGRRLPVALDESLRHSSGLPSGWSGWLATNLLEGDPGPTAAAQIGAPRDGQHCLEAGSVVGLPTWRP